MFDRVQKIPRRPVKDKLHLTKAIIEVRLLDRIPLLGVSTRTVL